MKQGMRFFLKPGSFVNQLQWSPHHTLILAAFFASAVVETQFGGHNYLYGRVALKIARDYGVSLSVAVWVVTFLKLVALQAGAWILTEVIHFLGTVFGKPASRRVLFRRLAVVFSIFLLAHTAAGLSEVYPAASMVSIALWAWGLLLGYLTLRGQFELNGVEATAIGVFVLFLAVGGWTIAVDKIETAVSQKPVPAAIAKRPLGRGRYR